MCEDCVKCLAVLPNKALLVCVCVCVCVCERVRVWLDTCMLGLYTSSPSAPTQHIVVCIICTWCMLVGGGGSVCVCVCVLSTTADNCLLRDIT